MRASSRQATTTKTIKELRVWTSSPEAVAHLASVADKMHALLVVRADELDGCTEGSPEEADYIKLVEAIETYEAKRWPEGKIPGGRG